LAFSLSFDSCAQGGWNIRYIDIDSVGSSDIDQVYVKSNTINWEETKLDLSLQYKYNLMIKTNAKAKKKINENEIVSI
tara:strand:+ start:170 stop:403 length:234 start_codon:yes stop_codon:yes gene_type:complete